MEPLFSFPYHTIPDGSVFLSHHFTWAMLLAVIPLARIWDDYRKREPWIAVTAIVIGLIAFMLVWPTHHVLGAILAVAATVTALTALLGRLLFQRDEWSTIALVVAFILVLVAADDVLQHAFGWPTPLDFTWKTFLRPMLPSH